MKRALVFGAGLLLAVAAITTEFLASGQRGGSTASRSPSDAAAELRQALEAAQRSSPAHEEARRAALVHSPRLQPNADRWNRPFSEVYDEIHAAAKAGDGQAAYVLGSRSARCMRVLRGRSPEVLLSEYRRDMETIEVAGDPKLTEIRLSNTNGRFQRELEAYEDCAVLGEDQLSGYLAWLERAGRDGVEDARVAFAQYAMSEYHDDRGALIAQIEVARERRIQARAWLDSLIRKGNEQALRTYVEELSSGNGLFTGDFAISRTYAYALDLAVSRRIGRSYADGVDRFPQLWNEGPIRYGDELTSQQWDAVTERGRQIYRESFATPPPNP